MKVYYEKKKDKKTGFWMYEYHLQHCKGWKIVDIVEQPNEIYGGILETHF